MKSLKRIISVFLILIIMTGVIAAESEGAVEGEVVGQDSMIIKFDYVKNKDDVIQIKDGIEIIKGDITINAERGDYYKKEDKAELAGDILLEHENGQIESTEMTGWLKNDKYIFNNNVKLLQRLDDGEFNLESTNLEMDAEDKSFTAKKEVVIDYNQRILKSDTAVYNDKEQTLTLSDNVLIEENNDWIKGSRAVFNLETEEFTVDKGQMELTL